MPRFIFCASSSQLKQSSSQCLALYSMPAAVNQSNLLLNAPLYTLYQQQSTKAVFSSASVPFFVLAAVNQRNPLLSTLCTSSSQSTQFSTQYPASYFVPVLAVNQRDLLLSALFHTLCQQQSIKIIFSSVLCSILCASSSQPKQFSSQCFAPYSVLAAVNQSIFLLSALLYTLCQQQSTKMIFSSALCFILYASSSQPE